ARPQPPRRPRQGPRRGPGDRPTAPGSRFDERSVPGRGWRTPKPTDLHAPPVAPAWHRPHRGRSADTWSSCRTMLAYGLHTVTIGGYVAADVIGHRAPS